MKFKLILKRSSAIFVVMLLFSSCATYQKNKEARKDKQAYEKAVKLKDKMPHSLQADMETTPVSNAQNTDDAADDPAIWYNEKQPEKSIIFGSNKKAGIHAYNLKGEELQFVPCGKINNIDLRKKVQFGSKNVDILAGSNRSDHSIVIFIIDEKGHIAVKPDYVINLGKFKPYGFCMSKAPNGKARVFVNNKKGAVHQISIDLNPQNEFVANVEKVYQLSSQVEGMVVYDATQKLYVGQEDKGVFVFDTDQDAGNKGMLLNGTSSDNPMITYDLEGLALIGDDYLLVSIQGNSSYALFDLKNDKYLTSFSILNGLVDGTEDTDGIEVSILNFGKKYPKGILVVQDGFNYDKTILKNQNFKLVDLRKVLKLY